MNILIENISKNIDLHLYYKIKTIKKVLTFFCILSIYTFIILGYAQAAVIPGEGVPHIVDSPAGEIETTDNVYNTSVEQNTAGGSDTSSYSQSSAESSPAATRPHAEKNQEMPEAPNFDSNIDSSETVKHPKNNNGTYIIIGLVILLVGVGLIFVAKSRRE